MARIAPVGSGAHGPKNPRVFHPKPKKAKKAKKGRTHKAKKGKTTRVHVRKPAARPAFHEQAGAGAIGGAHSGSLPFSGSSTGGSTAGASPRALLELAGISTATEEGLGGALLDLVGEGTLTVAHALAAWTHEQDRLANRAWRRPGGMVRMGGL